MCSSLYLYLLLIVNINMFGMCLIGFIIHLVFSWFVGFWCFHTFHLFLSLVFPFRVKQLMKSAVFRRKVHLTEVVVVLLVGFPAPIITLAISKYQDNGWYCSPQSQEVVFYGGIAPGVLVFVIGLALLFGSFWVLRRVSRLMYY